jgi:hypothetical protein
MPSWVANEAQAWISAFTEFETVRSALLTLVFLTVMPTIHLMGLPAISRRLSLSRKVTSYIGMVFKLTYFTPILVRMSTWFKLVPMSFLAEIQGWKRGLVDFSSLSEQGLLVPQFADLYSILSFTLLFLSVVPFVHLKVFPAIGRHFGLQKQSQLLKFSDAALQASYYTPIFIWEFIVCLQTDWAVQLNYFPEELYSMNSATRWIYIVQLAWYTFGLCEAAFIPSTRRKDLVVMTTHHIITILVVSF